MVSICISQAFYTTAPLMHIHTRDIDIRPTSNGFIGELQVPTWVPQWPSRSQPPGTFRPFEDLCSSSRSAAEESQEPRFSTGECNLFLRACKLKSLHHSRGTPAPTLKIHPYFDLGPRSDARSPQWFICTVPCGFLGTWMAKIYFVYFATFPGNGDMLQQKAEKINHMKNHQKLHQILSNCKFIMYNF